MGTTRTKVDVTYSRTIQLKQYTPLTVGLTTTLENPTGITEDEMKAEEKSLEDFVDSVIAEALNKL